MSGKAWHLGNKWCKGKKTKRTELFVHTKKPWPGVHGYYSEGCIKVRPKHANEIARLQKALGMQKKLYVES